MSSAVAHNLDECSSGASHKRTTHERRWFHYTSGIRSQTRDRIWSWLIQLLRAGSACCSGSDIVGGGC